MLPACILCGTSKQVSLLYPSTVSDADLNATVFSARRMPDRIHGTILRCDRCGLLFPDRIIDVSHLRDLYTHASHDYSEMEPFIRHTYARSVRRARTHILSPRPWKALDVGCGNGFMLSVFADEGCEPFGIEPSTDSISKADPRFQGHIIQGMASEETLTASTYDLITCFQTLDHLPDPVAFVRLCERALRPGGVMLCINHDTQALTAKILGERSPIIDIEHTYLHNKRTMRMLFEQAAFSDITVFSVRNDYPLWYWMHLLPLPGKKWLCGFLKRSPIGRIIMPFYAGNLGLIARKKVH